MYLFLYCIVRKIFLPIRQLAFPLRAIMGDLFLNNTETSCLLLLHFPIRPKTFITHKVSLWKLEVCRLLKLIWRIIVTSFAYFLSTLVPPTLEMSKKLFCSYFKSLLALTFPYFVKLLSIKTLSWYWTSVNTILKLNLDFLPNFPFHTRLQLSTYSFKIKIRK